MRFEIRAGGGFLILLGLVGLSGAVFALGLVAGYEMAKQNQPDVNQISSTYAVPNAPEKPAPVSEMSAAAVASPSVASEKSAPPSSPIKPPAPAIGAMPPAARGSPAAVARLKPPPEPAVNRAEPDDGTADTGDDSETASAPEPPAEPARALPPGAKPYNIQIEAVMDKSGADEMVTRLKSIGYNAQEIKIALNGGTWYRVRVGPFASAEEASAAQERLREQYKQQYVNPH
ncbi:MAG TPA: SPOR domain-containing protein [Candidatus Acidoferrum sp.]|nr:SPOR domain-containing protein [Candidatus Acidoferrum sp.]